MLQELHTCLPALLACWQTVVPQRQLTNRVAVGSGRQRSATLAAQRGRGGAARLNSPANARSRGQLCILAPPHHSCVRQPWSRPQLAEGCAVSCNPLAGASCAPLQCTAVPDRAQAAAGNAASPLCSRPRREDDSRRPRALVRLAACPGLSAAPAAPRQEVVGSGRRPTASSHRIRRRHRHRSPPTGPPPSPEPPAHPPSLPLQASAHTSSQQHAAGCPDIPGRLGPPAARAALASGGSGVAAGAASCGCRRAGPRQLFWRPGWASI